MLYAHVLNVLRSETLCDRSVSDSLSRDRGFERDCIDKVWIDRERPIDCRHHLRVAVEPVVSCEGQVGAGAVWI